MAFDVIGIVVSDTEQVLLEKIRNHVGSLAGDNHPIIQVRINVPNLTTQQSDEALAVVP